MHALFGERNSLLYMDRAYIFKNTDLLIHLVIF